VKCSINKMCISPSLWRARESSAAGRIVIVEEETYQTNRRLRNRSRAVGQPEASSITLGKLHMGGILSVLASKFDSECHGLVANKRVDIFGGWLVRVRFEGGISNLRGGSTSKSGRSGCPANVNSMGASGKRTVNPE